MSEKTKDGARALVINPPFEEPKKYWRFNRETGVHELAAERRPAGYVVYNTRQRGADSRQLVLLDLAQEIRGPVGEWRNGKYPGVTATTRRLLRHWSRESRPHSEERPFFFCQLEAIETLIWLAETAEGAEKSATIQGDGGPFSRVCAKMATGTGKTAVMGMLVAWQVLNSVERPRDLRFSREFLAVAPGLTVKRRLEVLRPSSAGNIYDDFRIVPLDLRERLNKARLEIHNWHALSWETDEKLAKKRTVDKRGAWSDGYYARHVLGDVGKSGRLVVINDEAHHAWRSPKEEAGENLYSDSGRPIWRLPAGVKVDADKDAAKVWLQGLDRLNRTRPILQCYDFSATPFVPTGHANVQATVFPWIVSDFGLNDAIESGLVKIPRIVARDDAMWDPETKRSRFWHIYSDQDVEPDIKRKDHNLENVPPPGLVIAAYSHLGESWKKAQERFKREKRKVPPVMISVVNNTTTAERIVNAARRGLILDGACSPEDERTLNINSEILKKAEKGEGGAKADEIRQKVDGVGKSGSTLEHVISVAMLSEGWDAKTVTHIMGLRAFTSQLLCEQVVGRGLRRMDHDLQENGMFSEETVNVFGVPFDILEGDGGGWERPPSPVEKTRIEVDPAKAEYEMAWPRVSRVGMSLSPRLRLNWDEIKPMILRGSETPLTVEMQKVVDGNTLGEGDLERIDLRKLDSFRTQRMAFLAADLALENRPENWPDDRGFLAAQLILLAEEFFRRKVEMRPRPRPGREGEIYRRLMLGLRFPDVLNHFFERVNLDNAERLVPLMNEHSRTGGTAEMNPWETARPCVAGRKSHINYCVVDKGWEHLAARRLDEMDEVAAWVKNDHLDFQIEYFHRGSPHRYYPDFLIRLHDEGDRVRHLILEVTGREWEGKEEKKNALMNWTRAINGHGGFGKWHSVQVTDPDNAVEVIRHIHRQSPA